MGFALQPWQLVVLILLGFSFILMMFALPLWYICRKAGFSPWLTLLNCIPFGTPVLLYLLAFADWKRHPMYAESPAPEISAVPAPQPNKPIPIRPS